MRSFASVLIGFLVAFLLLACTNPQTPDHDHRDTPEATSESETHDKGGHEHGAHDDGHDGMKTEPHSVETAVNDVCPLMAEPVMPGVVVDFGGVQVGFCCEQCIEDWSLLSDAEKTEKLAAVRRHEEHPSAGE